MNLSLASSTVPIGVRVAQGFSVEGQENIQEVLSKRLYMCQMMVALGVLRAEGRFVCKLFDLTTPFSAGLVYLAARVFRRVTLFKPLTSRPANSERYSFSVSFVSFLHPHQLKAISEGTELK